MLRGFKAGAGFAGAKLALMSWMIPRSCSGCAGVVHCEGRVGDRRARRRFALDPLANARASEAHLFDLHEMTEQHSISAFETGGTP